jgi:hypothetical protein
MQCKKKNQLSNVTKKGETIVALIVLMAPRTVLTNGISNILFSGLTGANGELRESSSKTGNIAWLIYEMPIIKHLDI